MARSRAKPAPARRRPAVRAGYLLALDGGPIRCCLPSRQALRGLAPGLPDGPLVACRKGSRGGFSPLLPLEVLAEAHPGRTCCVLTGPNFAAEVARGLPAAAVVAGVMPTAGKSPSASWQHRLSALYGNDDPIGAQVGGAAKNVVAIAAGVVIGAGLGENARAALVTRGLAELARLAAALGGRAETVSGLSGLGDLLLTCTGASSRNFSFGLALGQGRVWRRSWPERDR